MNVCNWTKYRTGDQQKRGANDEMLGSNCSNRDMSVELVLLHKHERGRNGCATTKN